MRNSVVYNLGRTKRIYGKTEWKRECAFANGNKRKMSKHRSIEEIHYKCQRVYIEQIEQAHICKI